MCLIRWPLFPIRTQMNWPTHSSKLTPICGLVMKTQIVFVAKLMRNWWWVTCPTVVTKSDATWNGEISPDKPWSPQIRQVAPDHLVSVSNWKIDCCGSQSVCNERDNTIPFLKYQLVSLIMRLLFFCKFDKEIYFFIKLWNKGVLEKIPIFVYNPV